MYVPTKSSQKEYIQAKMKEYANSFTVHGLTRSIKSKNIESVLWLITLLIRVACSSIIIYGLVIKFNRHAVYTEIKFHITDRNYFPSVTFCENQLLIDSYFAYCGVASRLIKANIVDTTLPCVCCQKSKPANVSADDNYWATELFNVTKCSTWSGKVCNNNKYLKTLERVNNSCITWNYRGDFYEQSNHVDIEFKFKMPSHLPRDPMIFATLHDPGIIEIDATGKIDIGMDKHYDIKIDKTIVKRLPAPFPGNCSIDKNGDIFPGIYSRHTCIESHNIIEMYKVCGDTFDYTRNHIPQDIKRKYEQNVTINELTICSSNFASRVLNSSYSCQFPCENLELNIVSYDHESINEDDELDGKYTLSIEFQRVGAYKVMEEKELYTWNQMACEIGGFIALVMGMSLISVVEILAYICLSIIGRFLK